MRTLGPKSGLSDNPTDQSLVSLVGYPAYGSVSATGIAESNTEGIESHTVSALGKYKVLLILTAFFHVLKLARVNSWSLHNCFLARKTSALLRENSRPSSAHLHLVLASVAMICIPQAALAQTTDTEMPAESIHRMNLSFDDRFSFDHLAITRRDQPRCSAISVSGPPQLISAEFAPHRALGEFAFTWQPPDSLSQSEPVHTPQTDNAAERSAPQNQSAPPLDRRDRIFYPGDTERLKPLGRKLLLNILVDQKEIFTSPFHVSRENATWWLLAAGTTAGLIAADHHIANAFENSRGQVQWGGRISQIGASYTLVPLVAGYYGYGVWKDHAKAREIGVLGTEALVDSLIVAGVLKEITRRNRPDEKNPGDFWGGGTSFPSGHAIQMWSIASLVAHEYKHQPIVGVAAYGLAAVVSASRIAAQKHFASDIFVGGTIGWFIGRYVYETHMSHLAHKHASFIPMIFPQFAPNNRIYTVALLFGGADSVHDEIAAEGR
jgi:membrane-associated phospholipid phosphatase